MFLLSFLLVFFIAMSDFDLTIYQVIKKYKLLDNNAHMRSLGQNFIIDESLLDKIVKSAFPIDNNSCIIEIGPGPCGLTRSILKHCNNEIICIEKDFKFKQLHDNILNNTNKNIKFIYGDALKININELTSKKIVIISNLPYNVGTALLIKWLSNNINQIDTIVVMLQDEVIDRICASHNNKQYGKISVISQLLCNVEKLFTVSNKAFIPSPKVTSAVVKLIPKNSNIENLSKLIELLDNCFLYRRKMIYSTLMKFYKQFDKQSVNDILNKCNILPQHRPENITPIQYYELSKYI